MSRKFLTGCLLAFFVGLGLNAARAQVGGGTVIASNSFEGVESWTFTTTGSVGAGATNTLNGGTDNPTNARIRTGSFSWQNRGNGAPATTSNILTSASVDISTFTNRQVVLRVASISGSAGNGAEQSDFLYVYVALDGAAFAAEPEIRLQGNTNARWGFNATNFIQLAAGSSVSNNAPQSGGPNVNNYANLAIDIPNTATSVAVRVIARNNDTNEYWCIDDAEVHASAPGWVGPAANPPVVAVTTADATVPFSTNTYDIAGTANVNTVGDLTWTNTLTGGSGTIPAVASWSIANISLAVGTNVIFVRGTNSTGASSQDSAAIIRGSQPNLPPLLSLSPTTTVYSVNIGSTVSFTVTGSQPPGDPGQATTITGTSIPVGATFNDTNGAAPVAATFTYVTATIGTFSPVFVVSDVDGAVTQTVSITVNPVPLATNGTLATYTFTGSSLAPSSLGSNITANSFSVSDARTITFPGADPAASATGWNVTNRYWEFTVTVGSGYEASFTNFSFKDQASGTGATNWYLRTSLDGFAADLAGGPTTNDITLPAHNAVLSLTSVTGAVTVRLYGAGASGAAGTWRVDNVTLQGDTLFVGGGGETTLDEYDIDAINIVSGVVFVTVNVTSNGVPYSLFYTTNLLTAPTPVGSPDTETGTGGPITLQDSSTAGPYRFYWIRTNDD